MTYRRGKVTPIENLFGEQARYFKPSGYTKPYDMTITPLTQGLNWIKEDIESYIGPQIGFGKWKVDTFDALRGTLSEGIDTLNKYLGPNPPPKVANEQLKAILGEMSNPLLPGKLKDSMIDTIGTGYKQQFGTKIPYSVIANLPTDQKEKLMATGSIGASAKDVLEKEKTPWSNVSDKVLSLFAGKAHAADLPKPGTPEHDSLMDKADKGWEDWSKAQTSPHEQSQEDFYDWRNKGLLFSPYESMSSGLGGRNRAAVAAAKEAAAAEAAAAAAAEEERKRKAKELQDYLDYLDSLKEDETSDDVGDVPITATPELPFDTGPAPDITITDNTLTEPVGDVPITATPVLDLPDSTSPDTTISYNPPDESVEGEEIIGATTPGPHGGETIITGGGATTAETTAVAQTQFEAEVEAVVQTQSSQTQTAAITSAASNSQASYEQEAFGGGGRATATTTTAVTGRGGSGGGGGGRATATTTTATTTGGGASKSSGDWKHLFK